MATARSRREGYHHGNLRQALVTTGVDLARQGGPLAISIREATRRVGVSSNAAYRHFADLNGYLAAVQVEALSGLTARMQASLALVPLTRTAGQDAWNRAAALGRGYVDFAIDEPGLFSTAFIGAVREATSGGPIPPAREDAALLSPTSGEKVVSPFRMLFTVLSELEAAGYLPDGDVEAACLIAWAHVHGVAQLLLGPLADLDAGSRASLITTSIENTLTGLTHATKPAGT